MPEFINKSRKSICVILNGKRVNIKPKGIVSGPEYLSIYTGLEKTTAANISSPVIVKDNNIPFVSEIGELKRMKKKVLVVGSGESILNYKFGSQIDMFDIVVRFNGFDKAPLIEYTGSKVDYVFCNTSVEAYEDIILKNRIVKNCNYILTYKKDSIEGTQRLKIMTKKLMDQKFKPIIIPTDNYGRFIRNNRRGITSGLVAILYFLSIYEQVTIHGFDLVQGHEGNLGHYYDDKPTTLTQFHNLELEAEFIKDLIKIDRVRLLSKVLENE